MTSDFERGLKDADDAGLREMIARAEAELKKRDAARKEEARRQAQTIVQKAQEEARAVLNLAGLPFEQGKAKRRRATSRDRPVSNQKPDHPEKQ